MSVDEGNCLKKEVDCKGSEKILMEFFININYSMIEKELKFMCQGVNCECLI